MSELNEQQKNIVSRCGAECEACLQIAARYAAVGYDAQAAVFRDHAAKWSARAFEEVQS